MIQQISLKGTLISLIESIDMFNYLLKDHHRRVAIISYNLGIHLGLSNTELKNLVFAASLHDIGALTVMERDNLIKMDVENPRNHEIIGCAMLKSFKPFNTIANIILHHHIKWSEIGLRYSLDEVDKVCFLLHLADRIDILIDPAKDILIQVPQIIALINSYSGKLFAPWAIKAFNEIAIQETFWLDINHSSLNQILSQLISDELDISIDENDLDELVFTFSRIVDFRSRFTATHSIGVGSVAFELAKLAGMSHEKCHKIMISGYLHDIGKIAIPTELIEKKGPLTDKEYEIVKMHSYYTYLILSKIKGLEDICNWATRHHEKYDGSGYPYHIKKSMFSIEIDILAYADIFTSLCENRPYRQGIQPRRILSILKTYSECKLSKSIFKLVEDNFTNLNSIRYIACENGNRFYDEYIDDFLL